MSYNTERLPPQALRSERLWRLKQFYLEFLVEDRFDGTNLDGDVLDMIEILENKYRQDDGSR
jgi:hypothetical protein